MRLASEPVAFDYIPRLTSAQLASIFSGAAGHSLRLVARPIQCATSPLALQHPVRKHARSIRRSLRMAQEMCNVLCCGMDDLLLTPSAGQCMQGLSSRLRRRRLDCTKKPDSRSFKPLTAERTANPYIPILHLRRC
eukprot:6208256-Pleurochrysis_carterae.AAC.2